MRFGATVLWKGQCLGLVRRTHTPSWLLPSPLFPFSHPSLLSSHTLFALAPPPCPADVVVVTATRDGMNLVPYEYVVCRQGPASQNGSGPASAAASEGSAGAGNGSAAAAAATVAAPPEKRHSMLVVSEFVGCSPSLSGAIRVNPWSIEAVSGGGGAPHSALAR